MAHAIMLIVALGLAALGVQETTHTWIGPDGQPLPFRSEEEILDFLRTADVIEQHDIGQGINRTRRLLLEKDGVRAHAAFREVDITLGEARVGDRFYLVFRDSYIFECAAYRLAKMLGMDSVPPAVPRRLDRTDGSVQLWLEGARAQDAGTFRPPDASAWAQQLWTMNFFDALVYNVDRNPGNLMVGADYKLWLIDHTRAFQRKSDPLELDKVVRVPRQIWKRLVELDESHVRNALDDFLDPAQISSLLARRDKLIEYVNRLSAERGADIVFFESQ